MCVYLYVIYVSCIYVETEFCTMFKTAIHSCKEKKNKDVFQGALRDIWYATDFTHILYIIVI